MKQGMPLGERPPAHGLVRPELRCRYISLETRLSPPANNVYVHQCSCHHHAPWGRRNVPSATIASPPFSKILASPNNRVLMVKKNELPQRPG